MFVIQKNPTAQRYSCFLLQNNSDFKNTYVAQSCSSSRKTSHLAQNEILCFPKLMMRRLLFSNINAYYTQSFIIKFNNSDYFFSLKYTMVIWLHFQHFVPGGRIQPSTLIFLSEMLQYSFSIRVANVNTNIACFSACNNLTSI